MSYQSIIEENKEWIDEIFSKLDKKLSRTAVKSRYKIPYTSVKGEHTDKKDVIDWWTNGFWGGLMWLMYDATKNEDSILQMGTEAYKWGHHMPIIYGDFFYTEAILKLKNSDFLIW